MLSQEQKLCELPIFWSWWYRTGRRMRSTQTDLRVI